MKRKWLLLVSAYLAMSGVLGGCQSLPDHTQVVPSHTLPNDISTRLARNYDPLLAQHPGDSGVYPLVSGLDALVARLAAIGAAERTLDLQYYIWHSDKVGKLVSWSILEAAERGVRVRMLLDDMGSPLGDETLIMLDQHPNIEIRLFNPLANRSRRLWSMATEFGRVNRRMHNKSLTADNTFAIVGGRNIGNEYFEATDDVAFADLDLGIIGPVVKQVSQGFDLYWNYETTFPVSLLTKRRYSDDELALARAEAEQYIRTVKESDYAGRLQKSDLVEHYRVEDWFWGEAAVLYDHPGKALADGSDDSQWLSTKLSAVFAHLNKELLLVSPYFVPGESGMQFFRSLKEKGIAVTVVTNSLAATDVGAVHSGYARYRKELLAAGVDLYEMRPDAESDKSTYEAKQPAYVGSSAQASLHAKAFFLDRTTTFVGSMNLDPRSFLINTEIGVVFENPEFTSKAHDEIIASLKESAYELSLEGDEIRWLAWNDGVATEYESEPEVSVWRRVGVWFLGLLPIESQL